MAKRNEDLAKLQQLLILKGYLKATQRSGRSAADGIMGPKTLAALDKARKEGYSWDKGKLFATTGETKAKEAVNNLKRPKLLNYFEEYAPHNQPSLKPKLEDLDKNTKKAIKKVSSQKSEQSETKPTLQPRKSSGFSFGNVAEPYGMAALALVKQGLETNPHSKIGINPYFTAAKGMAVKFINDLLGNQILDGGTYDATDFNESQLLAYNKILLDAALKKLSKISPLSLKDYFAKNPDTSIGFELGGEEYMPNYVDRSEDSEYSFFNPIGHLKKFKEYTENPISAIGHSVGGARYVMNKNGIFTENYDPFDFNTNTHKGVNKRASEHNSLVNQAEVKADSGWLYSDKDPDKGKPKFTYGVSYDGKIYPMSSYSRYRTAPTIRIDTK